MLRIKVKHQKCTTGPSGACRGTFCRICKGICSVNFCQYRCSFSVCNSFCFGFWSSFRVRFLPSPLQLLSLQGLPHMLEEAANRARTQRIPVGLTFVPMKSGNSGDENSELEGVLFSYGKLFVPVLGTFGGSK